MLTFTFCANLNSSGGYAEAVQVLLDGGAKVNDISVEVRVKDVHLSVAHFTDSMLCQLLHPFEHANCPPSLKRGEIQPFIFTDGWMDRWMNEWMDVDLER